MSQLQIFRSLPINVCVACSGGVDSVSLALYLKSTNRNVSLVYYEHPDDPQAKLEKEWLIDFQKRYEFVDSPIFSSKVYHEKKSSREMWWRENRLEFFKSLNRTILTGHHLDDAVEWYLMTSLTGEGHYMKYEDGFLAKPFLLQSKKSLVSWVEENHGDLDYIEDETNFDPQFSKRNYVRNELIPKVLEFNPGFYSTIRNKLIQKNS